MALDASNWTSDYFLTNKSECLSRLGDEEFVSSISNLDVCPLDEIKHGQLVKFRGMIQDIRNPEFYFEKYSVRNNVSQATEVRDAKYKDLIQLSPDEELIENSDTVNSERSSIVVISVPGLNNWSKQKCKNEPKKFFVDIFDKSIQSVNPKKRQQDKMEVDNETKSCKKEKRTTEESSTEQKVKENKEKLVISKDHLLNFPVPNEGGKCCIVKAYDEENFKLNEIIEVIGFISLDPNLSVVHDSEEIHSDLETQTHNPPASIIPRLHAVKVSTIKNPRKNRDPELTSSIQSVRSELHNILSHLLFNDNLAADYLICHFISSIYLRDDFNCLGSFPLNITNFPEIKNPEQSTSLESDKTSFPKVLYSLISTILPKSVYLECSLDNLNDLSFIPKKDYECERLTSGVLQLSHNTHLVIDETKLTPGRLSEFGQKNYNAICEVIASQKLNYDFKYYNMPYDTDIPILILSYGTSFIRGAVQVPIETAESETDSYEAVMNAVAMHMNDEQLLNRIRDYLQTLKFAEFKIDKDVSEAIQNDLVAMKNSNKETTADDYHRVLVFSRLMALSHGLESLTLESWKQSFAIEMERMNRVSKINKSKKK